MCLEEEDRLSAVGKQEGGAEASETSTDDDGIEMTVVLLHRERLTTCLPAGRIPVSFGETADDIYGGDVALRFVAGIGGLVLKGLRELGRISLLAWNIVRYLPTAISSRRLVLEQMSVIGVNALPLVLLIGAFTGAIAALQATNLFLKFNLIELARPYIGGSISTVVFTELSPVLTALVIAGRIGGAIAAQIGTMRVSEQIDALKMMAIDPDRYLAMPRVLAATLMMPVLIIFAHVVAILGAYILATFKFGISDVDFFGSVRNFFRISEVVIGLVKATCFGGVTALLGCYIGFSTTGGAEGVGAAAVKSFTLSSAAILIIDALFGYVL